MQAAQPEAEPVHATLSYAVHNIVKALSSPYKNARPAKNRYAVVVLLLWQIQI